MKSDNLKEILGERFYLGIFPVKFTCDSNCVMCDKDALFYAAWIFKGNEITTTLCESHAKIVDNKEKSTSKTDERYVNEGITIKTK